MNEAVYIFGLEPLLLSLLGSSAGQTIAILEHLKFQLKNIDHSHSYLAGRGISKEIAEQFGVGFFSGRGSMSGRMVFPIHNELGDLVAYAGRSIDDAVAERYRFPAGFHKSAVLYNLHRVPEDKPSVQRVGSRERSCSSATLNSQSSGLGNRLPLCERSCSQAADRVALVKGFFDCMRVAQAGYLCVALMGSKLSDAQQALLSQYFRRVALMLDGDEAGRIATDECLVRLGRQMWVKAVVLAEKQQPDQFSSAELRQLLLSV